MNWILPGTVLEVDGSRPEAADELFSSLFVTGGLVLSQVCQITGLEPYAVQNWVKRGFLAPPVKKKYNRRQLSRIIIINMLKTALPMESICRILSYVNGQLDDESDDIIDDSVMYLIFLRLAAANRDTWPPRGAAGDPGRCAVWLPGALPRGPAPGGRRPGGDAHGLVLFPSCRSRRRSKCSSWAFNPAAHSF